MPDVTSVYTLLYSFGVCCVFIVNAAGGGTVSQNCTYIQNEGYPSALTGTTAQTYTVQKCSSGTPFRGSGGRLDDESVFVPTVVFSP